MDTYDSAGPIGSTDCQIPIDINDLHNALNDEKSPAEELWTKHQIGEWTKKLGRYCEDMTLSIFSWSEAQLNESVQTQQPYPQAL